MLFELVFNDCSISDCPYFGVFSLPVFNAFTGVLIYNKFYLAEPWVLDLDRYHDSAGLRETCLSVGFCSKSCKSGFEALLDMS